MLAHVTFFASSKRKETKMPKVHHPALGPFGREE